MSQHRKHHDYPSCLGTIVMGLLPLLLSCTPTQEQKPLAPSAPTWAKVTSVLSVQLKGSAGIEMKLADKGWETQHVGQVVYLGADVRTAQGVQAQLTTNEGSVIHLNEGTTLTVRDKRFLKISSGELFADIAGASSNDPLNMETPAGQIRITGTKLNVKAEKEATVVDVSRGTVEVAGGGSRVEVGAGERATMKTGAAPRVSLSQDLAEVTRWAREMEVSPPTIESLQPGFGSLEARVPGQGKSFALRLASQKVRVTVQDNIARTEVEQEYYNSSSQTLEGTYRFPLPNGASISRLALWVGNRLEEGEIVERQRARQIFRQIVEDTIRPRDPALLEWVGGQTFQMKIFPIPPRGSRRVILAYNQPLEASYGRYRYIYPMATAAGKATTVGKFSLEVQVGSSRSAVNVTTPLYPVLQEKDGDKVRLRFESTNFTPARSFVANIAQDSAPPELQVAFFEPEPSARQRSCLLSKLATIGAMGIPVCGDRGGFFMAVLRPELPMEGRAHPQDYLFLLDSSYSTGKQGWATQVATLEAFLMEMDLRSRFNVLVCDSTCRSLGPQFQQPTSEVRQKAVRFVRGITPGGSSNLQGAFEEAAAQLLKTGVTAHVVYMGDGRPSAGEMREPELARLVVGQLSQAKAALSALQIGDDASEFFLPEATRRLAGAVHRIASGDDVSSLVFDIVAAQYRPTLTDLEISFEGVDVHHVYPRQLGSLSAGSEAVLVGRYDKGGEGVIHLRGKLAGRSFERRYPLSFAAHYLERQANTFIPRVWAKHHLDALSIDDYTENRPEIIRVSKAYTVLSRATAFLVLENERMYREFGVKRQKKEKDWAGAPVAMRTGRDQPEKTNDTLGKGAVSTTEKAPSGEAGSGSSAMKKAMGGASARSRLGDLLGSRGAGAESARSTAAAPAPPAAEPRAPAQARPRPARIEEAPVDRVRSEEAEESKERWMDAPAPGPRARKRRREDLVDNGTGSLDVKSDDEDNGPAPMASKAPMMKPKSMPKRSAASERLLLPPEDGSGFRSGRAPRPRLVFQAGIDPLPAVKVSEAAFKKEAALKSAIAASPLKRPLRQSLHRAMIHNAHYEAAMRHAGEWAELDGDHADALMALGDMQAAMVNAKTAMQTFASTVDVEPWNSRLHRQLAAMYENKGEQGLRCAHLWSLVSLAPKKLERRLQLARCLSILPEKRDQALFVLSELAATKPNRQEMARLGRALLEIQKSLGSRPAPEEKAPAHDADLTVSASWNRPVDLDLALITPRGERITSIHRGRQAAVIIDSRDGRQAEVLQAKRLPRGTYRLEINMVSPETADASVTGTVMIQARGKSQIVPFVLSQRTTPVAQVKISRSFQLPGRYR